MTTSTSTSPPSTVVATNTIISQNNICTPATETPKIVVTAPSADDIPCQSNRSPKRPPKFVENPRRKSLASHVPPLKYSPQPRHPLVINVRVKNPLSGVITTASVVNTSQGQYTFPSTTVDPYSAMEQSVQAIVAEASKAINQTQGVTTHRSNSSHLAQCDASTPVLQPTQPLRRQRRKSGILCPNANHNNVNHG